MIVKHTAARRQLAVPGPPGTCLVTYYPVGGCERKVQGNGVRQLNWKHIVKLLKKYTFG